ncbi:hypothetical protein BSY16_3425 [Sinorhizobium sp. RAC02]|nr:hypothetical protein BSY16_3425 [Sinorhizobium sp. RAC02]
MDCSIPEEATRQNRFTKKFIIGPINTLDPVPLTQLFPLTLELRCLIIMQRTGGSDCVPRGTDIEEEISGAFIAGRPPISLQKIPHLQKRLLWRCFWKVTF